MGEVLKELPPLLSVVFLQQAGKWLITGLGHLVLIGLSLQRHNMYPGTGEKRETLGGRR